MLASFVLCKLEWCWKDWQTFEHSQREWAFEILAKRIKPDDGAPEFLKNISDV